MAVTIFRAPSWNSPIVRAKSMSRTPSNDFCSDFQNDIFNEYARCALTSGSAARGPYTERSTRTFSTSPPRTRISRSRTSNFFQAPW